MKKVYKLIMLITLALASLGIGISWGEGQPSEAACETLVRFEGEPEIVFVEYELKPNCLEVQPGKIVFVLKNAGRSPHGFRIESEDVDIRSPRLGPGRTIHFEVELPEGEYRISCPLSNHPERGMVGILIVKPEERVCPCACAGLDQSSIAEDRLGELLFIC